MVFILWSPSLRKVQEPQGDPVIAIIYDQSYSMETVDAKLPKLFGQIDDRSVVSRKEWLKLALDDSLWKDVEETEGGAKIVKLPFSTNDASRTKNLSGSNYFDAVDSTLEKYDNLKAIIVMGDGDHNSGKVPSAAAQKAQLRRVPIYAIPIGSSNYLPDLEVSSLSAPKYGIVKEAVQIPFSIRSTLSKDIKTTVVLEDKVTKKQETKQITIAANSTYNDSILWRLNEEKQYDFSFSVNPHPSEVNSINNTQEFALIAKQESIKVLVIDSKPRWEYRFIRNALSRDPGVELDCLLLHPTIGIGNGPDYIQEFPKDLAAIQKYDVIFLGDIGIGENQLTIEQCDLIKGLVENQASGIVFIPGSSGNIYSLLEKSPEDPSKPITELANLIPVILDDSKKNGEHESTPSPLTLTASGKGSLLTMLGDSSEENARIWKKLPGFNWHMPIIKAKPGSDILAVHSSKRTANNQRMPMLVTQSYGNGKVLFLAHDSAWKWRRGVEDLYHYRFWGQVARWMSYKRNRAAGDNLRLYFSKDNPKPGDTIVLKANAFDENGTPLSDTETLNVTLTNPSGQTTDISLKREEAAWGAFFGRFTIHESGSYNITASTSLEPNKKLTTTLDALSIEIEKTGQPANFDILKEMAQITNGEFISAEEIPDLTHKILSAPELEPRVIQTDLRADLDKTNLPLWILGSMIGLLALFWTGRKFNGTF